ncbi:protein unc-93 homolog A-like isoform X2 [Ornithodoros turicata]|uniref:protein unc-93 homolog A-like isoform X2 n=1 Tax=Ornithodoros turicata TaxID=34597 RepID=UPI003139229E
MRELMKLLRQDMPEKNSGKDMDTQEGTVAVALAQVIDRDVAAMEQIVQEPIFRMTPDSKSRRLRVLVRNLLVVSLGFVLLFTSFQSLQNLQSSINAEENLGTTALAVLYMTQVVSSMFVPAYVIHLMGLKYALATSMLLYCTYFLSNFYPTWYTMIPAAVLVGASAAPMWTSKCAILAYLAGEYAALNNQDVSNVVTRFFSVFFMLFQTAQIWGNLISSVVLSAPGSNRTESHAADITQCGINFLPTVVQGQNNTNLEAPDDMRRYTLSAIYTSLALLAGISVLLFLEPIKTKLSQCDKPRTYLLVETLKQLRNPYQVAIVPLTFYSGIEQAFIFTDFSKAYVGCSWGISHVGYVMITFGVADASFSLLSGFVIGFIGRVPIFLLGAAVNIGAIIALNCWQPTPDEPYVFFLIAGSWGFADAVWQTQINAFYGVIFDESEEGSFANYRLWESTGFILAFTVYVNVRIYYKLMLLSVVLVIGMVCYIGIEIHIKYYAKKR